MISCTDSCSLRSRSLGNAVDLSSKRIRNVPGLSSYSRVGRPFPWASIHCSSVGEMLTSNPSGVRNEVSLPHYHQNRIIQLNRFRMHFPNGELRFGSARDFDSDAEIKIFDSKTSGAYSRRDSLIRSAVAVLGIVNYLGSTQDAQGSISKRVRLKDVDNQKLQDALRAAVAGDLENAEILFTEIIAEEPESASGWSNRGSVRVSLRKYELAALDFTKAIELAPEAPVPFLNRAISYEALGRYDEAIADCKTAIEYDPEEFAAWFNLGNVEVRVKDYDTALTAYTRASILAPGIAGYRFRQALVLFQIGRLDEAKKLLQGLVRKYPNYAEAHAALAAVLWSADQRSSAEEQFSQAMSLEPLYRDLSWVTSELEWPPGVLEAMSKFLSIDYQ